jgi:hypothetical protein
MSVSNRLNQFVGRNRRELSYWCSTYIPPPQHFLEQEDCWSGINQWTLPHITSESRDCPKWICHRSFLLYMIYASYLHVFKQHFCPKGDIGKHLLKWNFQPPENIFEIDRENPKCFWKTTPFQNHSRPMFCKMNCAEPNHEQWFFGEKSLWENNEMNITDIHIFNNFFTVFDDLMFLYNISTPRRCRLTINHAVNVWAPEGDWIHNDSKIWPDFTGSRPEGFRKLYLYLASLAEVSS